MSALKTKIQKAQDDRKKARKQETARKKREERKALATTAQINEIRDAYIMEDHPQSIRGLCERFNAQKTTVGIWARREEWARKRKEHWQAIQEDKLAIHGSQMVERDLLRLEGLSETIDGILKELSSKERIKKMVVRDLLDLMRIEFDLIHRLPLTGHQMNQGATVVEAQVVQVRAIGERSQNLNEIVSAGLRRLGLFAEQAAPPPPSDGLGAERENVTVRNGDPSEHPGGTA